MDVDDISLKSDFIAGLVDIEIGLLIGGVDGIISLEISLLISILNDKSGGRG
jgi:hypothetical protein